MQDETEKQWLEEVENRGPRCERTVWEMGKQPLEAKKKRGRVPLPTPTPCPCVLPQVTAAAAAAHHRGLSHHHLHIDRGRNGPLTQEEERRRRGRELVWTKPLSRDTTTTNALKRWPALVLSARGFAYMTSSATRRALTTLDENGNPSAHVPGHGRSWCSGTDRRRARRPGPRGRRSRRQRSARWAGPTPWAPTDGACGSRPPTRGAPPRRRRPPRSRGRGP